MAKLQKEQFAVRVMRKEDLKAIIDIDSKVSGTKRTDYYEGKLSAALGGKGSIATSLVAEHDGKVVGFVMGTIYTGEFGIPQSVASLDTIGVDPAFARTGVGATLLERYLRNLQAAGVEKVQTMVDWKDVKLLRFFNRAGFAPSTTLNLEKKI